MENTGGKQSFGIGLDLSELQNNANAAKKIFNDIENNAQNSGKGIDAAFKRIGQAVAGAFSVSAAVNFSKTIINVRKEIEGLEISFRTLLGSASKADALFGEIRKFAMQTPMMLGDLAKSAQTMLSFNIDDSKIMDYLKAIGDISMGDSQKFQSLTLAFSQMSSTGKLMGQDLLQMINAGFNPLAQISAKTGKSIADLKDEMSKGAISAEMIQQAFIDATSEGGKFYGMLEAQSQSVQGALSNLQGAIDDMLNNIGAKAQDKLVATIKVVQDLVQNYEKVGKVIAEIIAVFGVYKASLIAINAVKSIATQINAGWTASELLQYKALVLVEKAQKKLNATILKNPYVLVAAAIAALVYGIYKLATADSAAEIAHKRLNEAIEQHKKKEDDLAQKINKNIRILKDETQTLYYKIKAYKELIKLSPTLAKYSKEQIANMSQKELNEILGKEKIDREQEFYENEIKRAELARQNLYKMAETGAFISQKAFDAADEAIAQAKDNLVEFLKFKKRLERESKPIEIQIQMNNDEIAEYDREIKSLQTELAEVVKKIEELENSPHDLGSLDFNIGALLELKSTAEFLASKIKEIQGLKQAKQDENKKLVTTSTKVTKNKKYWEDYKKEQQALLDAMTEAELKSKKAEEIRKNIATAQEHIDAYSPTKDNQLAIQAAERTRKIEEYGIAVANASKQAEFDIRQATIDGMKDGIEKELAQNALNYDRLIQQNELRKQEMLEALRDMKELEWENANPNAKKEGKTFDRSSITEADLSPEQQKQLAEYGRVAAEAYQKANKDSLENMLSDVMTYTQKREEIEKEFARKREALYTTDENGNKTLRDGVTEGNVEELNRQAELALQAVDEEFASREETYQVWCNQLATMTLQQLETTLNQAKAKLAEIESKGGNDKDVAQARAAVAKVEKQITSKKAEATVRPGARTMKEWQDLQKTLTDIKGSFEEVGDAVGGVAGEIIEDLGSITTTAMQGVDGIMQLVTNSAKGMEVTAAAGATAMSTVEKASVILAVISAALQIAMKIASMIKTNDDLLNEQIEANQKAVSQLEWEINHINTLELTGGMKNFSKDVIAQIEEARNELGLYENAVEKTRAIDLVGAILNPLAMTAGMQAGVIAGWFKSQKAYKQYLETLRPGKNEELLVKAVNKVEESWMQVSYAANKALGTQKFKAYKSELDNIAKQQVLIADSIEMEQQKKKKDTEAIQKDQQKLVELQEKALELMDTMVEDVFGESAKGIADKLADSFIEAFRAGEDAAEAWGKTVNDVIAQMMKNMVLNNVLEEWVAGIFDKYKKKWFKAGNDGSIQFVFDTLEQDAEALHDELMGGLPKIQEYWDKLSDTLKGFVTEDATREATATGIATASQESVDELNGRATAIQGHTYSISENTKLLVVTANEILLAVMRIDTNTDALNNRMETIESNVRDVRSTLNDIALKGVKITS